MMSVEKEEKMGEEILRRAMERSYCRQKEKEMLVYTQDLLVALEEITDLPRAELDRIAEEVRTTCREHGEGLFAIRYQMIFVALSALTLLGIPLLAAWLL